MSSETQQTEPFSCACHGNHHMMVVDYFEGTTTSEVYFSLQVTDNGFWWRLKKLVAYLFGAPLRWDETLITSPKDCERMIAILTKVKEHNELVKGMGTLKRCKPFIDLSGLEVESEHALREALATLLKEHDSAPDVYGSAAWDQARKLLEAE